MNAHHKTTDESAQEHDRKAADRHQIIVSEGLCECHSMPARHARHREFPELWGEGGSTREAVTQLAQHLTRALDHVGSNYRREAILQAIADVEHFLDYVEREAAEDRAVTRHLR